MFQMAGPALLDREQHHAKRERGQVADADGGVRGDPLLRADVGHRRRDAAGEHEADQIGRQRRAWARSQKKDADGQSTEARVCQAVRRKRQAPQDDERRQEPAGQSQQQPGDESPGHEAIAGEGSDAFEEVHGGVRKWDEDGESSKSRKIPDDLRACERRKNGRAVHLACP